MALKQELQELALANGKSGLHVRAVFNRLPGRAGLIVNRITAGEDSTG